jgi:hypothetical protein
MIGPFDLLVDMPCCVCGGVLGALVMALAVIVSAGHPTAAEDRNSLADTLKDNGVSDETIRKILQTGLTRWALWRWKSRPMLWRWGLDWPEYYPLLESELDQHYNSLIPAPPPSVGQSSPPEPSEDQELGGQANLDALRMESEQPEPMLSEPPENDLAVSS